MSTEGEQDEKVQVVAKLSKPLVKQIDFMAVEWDCFRAEAVERILRFGLPIAQQQAQLQIVRGTA